MKSIDKKIEMMNAAERNDENIKKLKKLKKGLLISGIISIILGCLSTVVGVGRLIFDKYKIMFFVDIFIGLCIINSGIGCISSSKKIIIDNSDYDKK